MQFSLILYFIAVTTQSIAICATIPVRDLTALILDIEIALLYGGTLGTESNVDSVGVAGIKFT